MGGVLPTLGSLSCAHTRKRTSTGGIEADVKVEAPRASVLEVTLQQQGAFFDFATEWARQHEYAGQGTHADDPLVTEEVFEQFKRYVAQQVD